MQFGKAPVAGALLRAALLVALVFVSGIDTGPRGVRAEGDAPAADAAPAADTPAGGGGGPACAGYLGLAVGAPLEHRAVADAGWVNILNGGKTGLTTTDTRGLDESSPGVPEAAEADDEFGFALAAGDFNANRVSDLVVGAPYKNRHGLAHAGFVDVLYGKVGEPWISSGFGIEQGALNGAATEASDYFGRVFAIGDFDNDGYDDLSIGVPDEDLAAGQNNAGWVGVLYGSSTGLGLARSRGFHQGDLGYATPEEGDNYGYALAAGDFNRDGYDDLAVGAPGEDLGTGKEGAGWVGVLYGSSLGLTTQNSRSFTEEDTGVAANEAGDLFGSALAAGDFNGDGLADLAVGAPYEDIGTAVDAGWVGVFYGSFEGLRTAGAQGFDQQGVGGAAVEAGDHFGSALAAADFNRDSRRDLAVGAPHEAIGAKADAGWVGVLYGSYSTGLSKTGSTGITQDDLSGATAEAGDVYGDVLVAGDFDSDGYDDLAVAAPWEDIGAVVDAGWVGILYGAGHGISLARNRGFDQADLGIETPEARDQYGYALTTGYWCKKPSIYIPSVKK